MEENNPKTTSKVLDFSIGYFGFFAVAFILYFLVASGFPVGLVLILLPVIALVFANSFIRKSRRYVAKGINFAVLTLVLIPVLFFGACFISLNGLGR